MKPNILLFGVLAAILFLGRADACAQGVIIDWQGNGGYRAKITMTYDASFALVSARGDGRPFMTPTNQGISSLSVQFFAPSSSTPLYSTQDISNSIVTYRFLIIDFDTTLKTLIGTLDVGRDSFAEGGGSSSGQYHLLGVASPQLMNSFTGLPIDSGGQFTVTVVPEPSTWAIGVIGLTAIASARHLRPKST